MSLKHCISLNVFSFPGCYWVLAFAKFRCPECTRLSTHVLSAYYHSFDSYSNWKGKPWDKEGFWVSKMTLCQERYISDDLCKLQQLESSASQAELVQAIQLLKRRLPRKSMKTQHKFKQHWKDDYQCVEHDSLQANIFCKVCKSHHNVFLFFAAFSVLVYL